MKDSGAGVVGKLKKYFADITTPAVVDCADLPTRHKFLFEEIWTSFFGENEAIPSPFTDGGGLPTWPFPPPLASPRIIANFRGLIIGKDC